MIRVNEVNDFSQAWDNSLETEVVFLESPRIVNPLFLPQLLLGIISGSVKSATKKINFFSLKNKKWARLLSKYTPTSSCEFRRTYKTSNYRYCDFILLIQFSKTELSNSKSIIFPVFPYACLTIIISEFSNNQFKWF